MIDSIITSLIEAIPAILYFILGGGLVGLVMWFYAKKIKPVNDRTKNANCEHHTNDIKKAKYDILNIQNKFISISSDLSYIKGTLSALQQNSPNALTQSHSPLSLTEKGKEIAVQMGIEQLIHNNWEHIYKMVDDSTKTFNAYDIQQYCIETATVSIETFFRPMDVDAIKLFAFNAGNSLAYYGGMIGILIRDAFFKQKGIEMLDIDKYDPQVMAK